MRRLLLAAAAVLAVSPGIAAFAQDGGSAPAGSGWTSEDWRAMNSAAGGASLHRNGSPYQSQGAIVSGPVAASPVAPTAGSAATGASCPPGASAAPGTGSSGATTFASCGPGEAGVPTLHGDGLTGSGMR